MANVLFFTQFSFYSFGHIIPALQGRSITIILSWQNVLGLSFLKVKNCQTVDQLSILIIIIIIGFTNYIFLFDALLTTFVDFHCKTLFEIIRLFFFFIFCYKIWSVRFIEVILYWNGQILAKKCPVYDCPVYRGKISKKSFLAKQNFQNCPA